VTTPDTGEDRMKELALKAVEAALEGKPPKKVIVVKGRLVNVVV
jgi:leucyl-tRNA synthetase